MANTTYDQLITVIENAKQDLYDEFTDQNNGFLKIFQEKWVLFQKYFDNDSYFKLDTNLYDYSRGLPNNPSCYPLPYNEDNEGANRITYSTPVPNPDEGETPKIKLFQLPIPNSYNINIKVIDQLGDDPDYENTIYENIDYTIDVNSGIIEFVNNDYVEKTVTITYNSRGYPLIPILWDFEDGWGEIATSGRRIYNYLEYKLILGEDGSGTVENPAVYNNILRRIGDINTRDIGVDEDDFTIMGQMNLLVDRIREVVTTGTCPESVIRQYKGEYGDDDYKIIAEEDGEKYLIFQRDRIEEVKVVPETTYSLYLDYEPYTETTFEVSYADETGILTEVNSLLDLVSSGLFYPDIPNRLIFFHPDDVGRGIRVFYLTNSYKFLTRRQIIDSIDTIRDKRSNNQEITIDDYLQAKNNVITYYNQINDLKEVLKVVYEEANIISYRIRQLNLLERLRELRSMMYLLQDKLKEDISLLPLFLSRFVKKIYDVKN